LTLLFTLRDGHRNEKGLSELILSEFPNDSLSFRGCHPSDVGHGQKGRHAADDFPHRRAAPLAYGEVTFQHTALPLVAELPQELLAGLEGSAFIARAAVNKPANLMKAKKIIRRAFEMQINNMGFSMVEVLSACPTNWGLKPLEANRRVEEEMIPCFPLGVFKERIQGSEGSRGQGNTDTRILES